MSKQEPPNPYEYLKVQGVTGIVASPYDEQYRLNITDNNQETATIITRRTGEYWYGGFQFYWHHGNLSYKRPDPANGLFRTERETRLYYIAYLSLFLDYYLEDTKSSIKSALLKFSQQTLF